MINTELDTNTYKNIFSNEKIVVIPHFLSNDIAEKIYHKLLHQKKKNSRLLKSHFF